MPTLKQLLTHHSECDAKLLNKYDSLYQGGIVFKKNIREFLTRNGTQEPELQYARRAKEANYVSYVNSIINTYAAHLFSAPFTIRATKNAEAVESLDEYYTEFKEDIDLCGTDLTTFFKNIFIESLVKKCSYWLVEFPDDGEPLPNNYLDFETRGLNRAYLSSIPTESLINWECDNLGGYEWAIIHSSTCHQDSPFTEPYCTQTFKIYDKTSLSIYEISHPVGKMPKMDTEVPMVAQYPNRFGQVPILGLCLPDGLWLMNQVAEAQVEHFRLDAALGWSLRQSAYATLMLNLIDSAEPPKPTPHGVAFSLEEKASYLEPPCTSMKFLQDQIGKKKDEIYRVSSQMAFTVDNSASSLSRSGDSKQADMMATEICLRGYAAYVKEAIENTFEFISNARGETDLKFSIEGMNKFSVVDSATMIANATSLKTLGIPSETFEKEFYKYLASSLLPIDTKQEVKDKVAEEIDSADLEALKEQEKAEKLESLMSQTETKNDSKQGKAQKFPPKQTSKE